MSSASEQKIRMIDEYIEKLEQVIQKNDYSEARRLQSEIIAVYEAEIDNIKNQLDNYKLSFGNEKTDYIGDARLLKAKLINYKLNLSSGLYKVLGKGNSGVSVTQNVTQETSTYVNVTLENTISLINSIPSNNLSDEDKELLNGKLAVLSTEKDKNKRWEKIKNVLKWIADKGIEVGIAALPYIAKMVEG